MRATAIEVECPSCGGRSAVEPEHRHLPKWACPFCPALNSMPAFAEAKQFRRLPVASVASAAVLLAVVVVAVVTQASRPDASYRTVAGIVSALDCELPAVFPTPPPGARQAGSCRLGTAVLEIVTFRDERGTTAHLERSAGPVAFGSTWVVSAPDRATAERVRRTLRGRGIMRGPE